MIKSVLVSGLLLAGLPARSDAGHSPVCVTRIAANLTAVDEDNWKADALKPINLEMEGDESESGRSVAVIINRPALLAELPMLQEHNALSGSITKEDVAKQPVSYANALSLLLMSYAVRDLYKNFPELGRTHWKVSLMEPGDSGGQAAREIYSFRFDRPLYERTAWDRLPFTEFPKIADRFSYNLRFTLDLSHEVSGSIDDD